jgi:hypothetical protein
MSPCSTNCSFASTPTGFRGPQEILLEAEDDANIEVEVSWRAAHHEDGARFSVAECAVR